MYYFYSPCQKATINHIATSSAGIQFISASTPSSLGVHQLTPPRIKLADLPRLRPWEIILVSTSAGAGHKRPSLALLHALDCGTSASPPRIYLDTLSTRTHRFGSHGLGQFLTEFTQTHPSMQKVFIPLVHRLSQSVDLPRVRRALTGIVNLSPSSQILFIHFNPEPAYLAGLLTPFLSTIHRKSIKNILLVTDHFPSHLQDSLPLLSVDLIVAPDLLTSANLTHALAYWAKFSPAHSPPPVLTCPFPQDPSLSLPLTGIQLTERFRQLGPDVSTPLDLGVPLGGSAPGQSFLAQTISGLYHSLPSLRVWSTAKGNLVTATFANQLLHLGAQIELPDSDDELIAAYIRRFTQYPQPPSVVLVKPGELTNQMELPPHQLGGAIFLLAPPVGDQERRNKEYYRRIGLLPSPDHQAELERLFHSGSPLPDHLKSAAASWRGLDLPTHPRLAADFIFAARRSGLFQAMSQFTPPSPPEIGSLFFWSLLNNFLP